MTQPQEDPAQPPDLGKSPDQPATPEGPQRGQPAPGQPTYGQQPYGQPAPGQPTYGPPTYGQQPGHAQQQPSGPAYGQQPPSGYGPPAYGQQAGGGYGQQAGGGYGPPQVAGAERSPADQRQWSMLAHLSGLVNVFSGGGAVLLSLILYLVNRDRGGFVRRQSVEALNFHITLAIGFLVAWLLAPVGIGFLLLPVLIVTGAVFAIIAGVAADRGEDYRYPLNLRLVS